MCTKVGDPLHWSLVVALVRDQVGGSLCLIFFDPSFLCIPPCTEVDYHQLYAESVYYKGCWLDTAKFVCCISVLSFMYQIAWTSPDSNCWLLLWKSMPSLDACASLPLQHMSLYVCVHICINRYVYVFIYVNVGVSMYELNPNDDNLPVGLGSCLCKYWSSRNHFPERCWLDHCSWINHLHR